jgi:hypothetical protein
MWRLVNPFVAEIGVSACEGFRSSRWTYHKHWCLHLSQLGTSQPQADPVKKQHRGWLIHLRLKFEWAHVNDSEVPWWDILLALMSASFATKNFTISRWPFWEAT